MRFRAKVLTSTMEVKLVELDAGSADEARGFVEAAGERLVDLRQLRSRVGMVWGSVKFNLAVFNQQLHALLDAGQPVVDAIEVLGRNDRGGQHRAIYDILLNGLRQGKQLSDAMASLPSVFPQLYVAMLHASETTGTVRTAIRRFMRYQAQADEIRSKLVAAAIYPAILSAVGFVVIAFLMLYVVPKFSMVYDDVATSGRLSVGFVQLWGTFVRQNGGLAISGLVVLAALLATLAFHPAVRRGALKRLLDIPWIGHKIWILQLGGLYRTLGMLLHSGVSVITAMRMTEDSLAVAMRDEMRAATLGVSEGRAMSAVMLECGLSTEIAQRLLLAGESSGNLDEMMERIADFYDQETAMWIDTAGRLIEPVLMIVIGLVIGAIVLMLYSPIFDLANAI
jgi:general secretion pathway protein F